MLGTFHDLYEKYPAHLHMNTHENFRGLGLGALMLANAEAELRLKNIPGLHLVTEQSSRNYAFYLKQGFTETHIRLYNNMELCFMAKDFLSP